MTQTLARALEPAGMAADLFRAVVESMREAVVALAPDGRVLYANPAHRDLFGCDDTSWQDGYRSRWQPESRMIIERHLQAPGEDWEGVLQGHDAAGRAFSLWVRLAWTADGRFLHAFMHDYASARQSEQAALRARAEAEKANQAKTRFLAAASHDLRQPLQALGMFVAVLSNRNQDPGNRKIITRIEDSLAATDALLTSLLDISKLEAGMVAPTVGSVSVQRLLDRMREEFAPQAEKAGLSLRVLPCAAHLRSDGTLLERILRNLLSNALRYTDSGRVVLGCRRCGDRLRIEVHDTGAGIPDDQYEAIFRDFHQLGNPGRDRRQGLGLGLAIVERLGRLLDHPIRVRSTLHRGSCFTVEVPLAGVRPVTPRQLDLDIRVGGGLVAVIDDDTDVRESLRLALESWGYGVVTAPDADSAIEQLVRDRQVPDVIIADYRLAKGSTGGQAIARLRQRLRADIPAVILTGDTAPERLRMAQANGHSLLHKPVQPAELRRAIDEARQQRRAKPRRG